MSEIEKAAHLRKQFTSQEEQMKARSLEAFRDEQLRDEELRRLADALGAILEIYLKKESA